MFYTLASKLIIKGPVEGREFLFVFLAGSVMYVALHWYLHLDQKSGIVEQVRKYLYYAMAVDLAVAYVLVTFFAPAPKSEDKDDEKPKTKREYTDEEKKAIMAKMQEARRQQMKKASNGGEPQADQPQGQPAMPPIDPRTGLPMGMDPRMLLNMDPRNPPPGVDPRLIQQVQAAHAARLRQDEEESVQSEQSEKSNRSQRSERSEKSQRSNHSEKKKKSKSKPKKAKTVSEDDRDSERQEKHSIFSRSEESDDTPEDLDTPSLEPPKKVRVKKKDEDKSRDKETGSNLEDTEIPMFS